MRCTRETYGLTSHVQPNESNEKVMPLSTENQPGVKASGERVGVPEGVLVIEPVPVPEGMGGPQPSSAGRSTVAVVE